MSRGRLLVSSGSGLAATVLLLSGFLKPSLGGGNYWEHKHCNVQGDLACQARDNLDYMGRGEGFGRHIPFEKQKSSLSCLRQCNKQKFCRVMTSVTNGTVGKCVLLNVVPSPHQETSPIFIYVGCSKYA